MRREIGCPTGIPSHQVALYPIAPCLRDPLAGWREGLRCPFAVGPASAPKPTGHDVRDPNDVSEPSGRRPRRVGDCDALAVECPTCSGVIYGEASRP